MFLSSMFPSPFAGTPAGRQWLRSSVPKQFGLNLLFFAGLLLVSAAAGMIHARVFGGETGGSVVRGLFIGGFVIAFERGLIVRPLQRRIRGLSTFPYVLSAEVAYAAMIAIGGALGGVACV